MRRARLLTVLAAAIVGPTLDVPAAAAKCPRDSVQVGTLCLDKYEASVWEIPAGSRIVKKVAAGKIASASQLAGATQRGVAADDYGPGCPDDGSAACAGLYAVSIPGVVPAKHVTWFQAVALCANAGKRLPTNQEWQLAALGTPDTGGADDGATTCNTDDVGGVGAVPAGSRSACVSARGAFDAAGNVSELVADWQPISTACPGWGGFSDDYMCFAGASTLDPFPGMLVRGGDYRYDAEAGPLAVDVLAVTEANPGVGFRCAREL